MENIQDVIERTTLSETAKTDAISALELASQEGKEVEALAIQRLANELFETTQLLLSK